MSHRREKNVPPNSWALLLAPHSRLNTLQISYLLIRSNSSCAGSQSYFSKCVSVKSGTFLHIYINIIYNSKDYMQEMLLSFWLYAFLLNYKDLPAATRCHGIFSRWKPPQKNDKMSRNEVQKCSQKCLVSLWKPADVDGCESWQLTREKLSRFCTGSKLKWRIFAPVDRFTGRPGAYLRLLNRWKLEEVSNYFAFPWGRHSKALWSQALPVRRPARRLTPISSNHYCSITDGGTQENTRGWGGAEGPRACCWARTRHLWPRLQPESF